MTPGLHTMRAEQYHADPCPKPSLSASVAHILLTQSPLHAWHAHPKLNPNYRPDYAGRLDIGTAAHALLLEGDSKALEVIDPANYPSKTGGIPDGWANKAIRDARDAARAAGKTPVLAKDYATIDAMVRAAHDAVDASELAGVFDNGKPEQTCIWQDGGTLCRGRFDWLTNDGRIILDYKTAENASPDGFIRRMPSLGYMTQAAFYLRGARLTNLPAKFVFMVQEIEPPYACSFVSLSEAMLEIADAEIEEALDIWRECVESKKWPGYPSRICYAEPTSFQMKDHEMRVLEAA